MAVLGKQSHFVVTDLIPLLVPGNIVYDIVSDAVFAASADHIPATDALVSLDPTENIVLAGAGAICPCMTVKFWWTSA